MDGWMDGPLNRDLVLVVLTELVKMLKYQPEVYLHTSLFIPPVPDEQMRETRISLASTSKQLPVPALMREEEKRKDEEQKGKSAAGKEHAEKFD
ncbi:uncharacterized, partial [Tachysurus ichikawai]